MVARRRPGKHYILLLGVSGTVRDMRGNPIDGAVPATLPAAAATFPSDWHGAYSAFAGPQVPTYTVSVSHDGFGPLPAIALEGDWDKTYDAWLPPAADAVSNGQFESSTTSLQGWQVSGAISPSLSTDYRHSGQQSAVVGQTADFSPAADLSIGTPGTTNGAGWRPAIAVDHSGGLHVVWMDRTEPGVRLWYAAKPVEATGRLPWRCHRALKT